MYFKGAINTLVLDFEKWVLSLLRVCHMVKHLLNLFVLIFLKRQMAEMAEFGLWKKSSCTVCTRMLFLSVIEFMS